MSEPLRCVTNCGSRTPGWPAEQFDQRDADGGTAGSTSCDIRGRVIWCARSFRIRSASVMQVPKAIAQVDEHPAGVLREEPLFVPA
jgi:hypothetical protein